MLDTIQHIIDLTEMYSFRERKSFLSIKTHMVCIMKIVHNSGSHQSLLLNPASKIHRHTEYEVQARQMLNGSNKYTFYLNEILDSEKKSSSFTWHVVSSIFFPCSKCIPSPIILSSVNYNQKTKRKRTLKCSGLHYSEECNLSCTSCFELTF